MTNVNENRSPLNDSRRMGLASQVQRLETFNAMLLDALNDLNTFTANHCEAYHMGTGALKKRVMKVLA